MQQYPVFDYLPIESLIKENQAAYYDALSQSDKLGSSTPFIEFMLGVIHQSLEDLLKTKNRTLTAANRIKLFKEVIGSNMFSRKDYLRMFKEISQATASRDLKWAVEQKIVTKKGDKRLSKYRYKI